MHTKRRNNFKEKGDGDADVTWTSTGNVAIPLIGRLILDKIFEKRGVHLFENTFVP